ncbi:7309_t:CDS:10 [Funneliformis mosseae]|uniref:7309_t:CDS:1 n=1 Tax=Funneliformis mosseae TaxID=27381 RepID=A0A9N9C8E6_FUNMO|nr:7309_t:CDS:10 [Funneliformis mosseae]
MNMNSNSFVTPPEHIVHEHGSSNQVNINNNILPSRSNPTRTIPVDFTSEQQGCQPTKRRKSNTIKSEITKKDYQTLCAELLKYLQTDIAYSSPQCQESFYQCLQNIKSNFGSTPMEIGLSVFQAALNNIHRFSNTQHQNVEKANGNWVSRIIDRAWGHVMLPYESLIANQHQEQQEFINSFYIPHEKFERIWKLETASPATLIHPNKLPLTYRLISRKPNNIDDDNKCDWPPEEAMFKVQINDSEVKLHRKQRIPIKNNQYSFVGVDKAVDIAQYLEAGVNRIKITQCMCETCRQQLCEHILSIEILLKETEEIVLRNARSQTLTVEHGMEIVKRLISGPSASIINAQSPTSSISSPSHTMITDEDDCDVTVNKMKVSLRCPISLLRIAEPAKGQHCLHIGCFDLETYVSVNKKNSKWRCPECNDRVTSETLRIDEYFKRLLEQIPENVNTVELDSSGRWTVVGQDDCDGESTDDDDMQVDSASKKSSISSQKAPNTIIILDDDDDDELEPQPINNQQQVLSMQNNNMPTYDQSSTIIRQTSTPYTQPVRNDQSQLTNSIIIQSPPHSASLTTPSIPKNYLPQLPLSQLSADHTTYVEAIPPFYNNSNKSKRKSNSKKRRSRRKDMEVNTQDRVAGIQTLLLSPQDSVTKTATQVASPISPPISVTVPNHSQSEEWETEDEQEEVVLVSSTTV